MTSAKQSKAEKAAKEALTPGESPTLAQARANVAAASDALSGEANLKEAQKFAEEEAAAFDPAEAVKAPKGATPNPGLKPDKSSFKEPEGELAESVRVLIIKDETTTIPKRVFSHEVVILQELWGVDAVTVVEGSELRLPLTGDAAEEHERLKRVYGKKGEAAVLKHYPTVSVFAQDAGIKLQRKAVGTKHGKSTAPQSAQRGGGVE